MPSPRALATAAAALFVVVFLAAVGERAGLLGAAAAELVEQAAALLGLAAMIGALLPHPAARWSQERELIGRGFLSSEALACFTLSREGRIERWSRGAQALFGWTAEEIQGREVAGTVEAPLQAVELLAEAERLFETARAHPAHRRTVRNRDGRSFETVCVLVPLSRRGKVESVAVVHVDPHPPQLAEGRWNRLFNAAPAGLLRLDGDGCIEAVNRRFADWVGRHADALEGTDLGRSEIFPADFRDRVRSLARGPRESEPDPIECDVTIVGPSGTPRPCTAFVDPRPSAGADLVLVDGTSRRQLEAERDAARAAADAARRSASETVTTQRDLTSSVAQLMSALDAARGGGTPASRSSAADELHRSGRILLANIERLDERPQGGPGPTRVLLVDDNDENRDLIARMLRTRGAVVTSVGSGQEAVDEVARGWFDVVLLDIQMPGMDGYQVARRIRALPGGEAVSIVALTALGADAIREQCLAEGMDDFLSKPLTLAKVSELLARWGRGAPARQSAG